MNKEAEFLVKVAYLKGQADAQNGFYIKEAVYLRRKKIKGNPIKDSTWYADPNPTKEELERAREVLDQEFKDRIAQKRIDFKYLRHLKKRIPLKYEKEVLKNKQLREMEKGIKHPELEEELGKDYTKYIIEGRKGAKIRQKKLREAVIRKELSRLFPTTFLSKNKIPIGASIGALGGAGLGVLLDKYLNKNEEYSGLGTGVGALGGAGLGVGGTILGPRANNLLKKLLKK